jgi:tetratricopeptide (TPR) repeat protein
MKERGMSHTDRVRTQKLRNLTVQIRHATHPDQIIGTGVIVSVGGAIITCAHVIRDALAESTVDLTNHTVNIYFPQLRTPEPTLYQAVVQCCFPQHDDDIVLLHIAGARPPLTTDHVAVLGLALDSDGNEFRSYGYKRLGEQQDGYVQGLIMGPVQSPTTMHLQTDPIELRTRDVRPGVSGAAVLDVDRNLIIGLIARRWNPGASGADDNIAWAVDAAVLTFNPFNLPLQADDLPRSEAFTPQTAGIPLPALAAVGSVDLSRAPQDLAEWVGRETLLSALTTDWESAPQRIIGLIGFGGEGKTSLARHWVERVRQSAHPPRGIFWWAFYDNNNLDEFFIAVVRYLLGSAIDPVAIPSTTLRANVAAALLMQGPYMLVLDGIEVLQQQDGDHYGLFTNTDIRDFLQLCAAPGHRALCVMTSRTPLVDLHDWTTYREYPVDRLGLVDGRQLLTTLGVRGSTTDLDAIVTSWDGHSLTLTLIASYLVQHYQGSAAHMRQIPIPTSDEPRYDRVQRILHRYDAHLTVAERAFLMVFSAFRLPVVPAMFRDVFRAGNALSLTAPLQDLDDEAFAALCSRLGGYRMIRYNPHEGHYTTHPLIRLHYYARLTQHADQPHVHQMIDQYYRRVAGAETPHTPTLQDIVPLIESVHHQCRAGDYDTAYQLYRARINQGDRRVLTSQFGAHDTDLNLLQDFFPATDFCGAPLVRSESLGVELLNQVGYSHVGLGRLREALPFYSRASDRALAAGDWFNASIVFRNIASLSFYIGAFASGREANERALALARQAQNDRMILDLITYQGWGSSLQGAIDQADMHFREADAFVPSVYPEATHLVKQLGIIYATHLRRCSRLDMAEAVTQANLAMCETINATYSISQCYRVLGDLACDRGIYDQAFDYYHRAVTLVRQTSQRNVLMEGILARGCWFARYGHPAYAAADLDVVLTYSLDSGNQLAEVDARIGLAWMEGRQGNPMRMQSQATRAATLSHELGYFWGSQDAQDVLRRDVALE